MRAFFYRVGVVASVLIAVLIAAFLVLMVRGQALDREAKRFSDKAVVEIFSKWSSARLLDLASAGFQQRTSDREILSSFATWSRVGPLVMSKGCTGQTFTSLSFTGGSQETTAAYRCDLHFRDGNGTAALSLRRTIAGWKIDGLQMSLQAQHG